jgi:DNA-binding transcriptional LysR family regulator
VLAVRRGHPLLRQQGLDLPTLVPWPWVLQPPSSPSRQLFETELALVGVASPANVVECSSVFAVLQLIQGTDSVAAVSESVVRDHVRAGLIAVLPLRFGQVLRSFGVLSRRGEALSEAAQDFAGCLREVAGSSSGGAGEARARRKAGERRAPEQAPP